MSSSSCIGSKTDPDLIPPGLHPAHDPGQVRARMAMVSSVFNRPGQGSTATYNCWIQAPTGGVQPEGGSVAE